MTPEERTDEINEVLCKMRDSRLPDIINALYEAYHKGWMRGFEEASAASLLSFKETLASVFPKEGAK